MRSLLLFLCCAIAVAVEPPPLRVVCSTTILADIAKHVGGHRVEVSSLVAAGTDPHTFQPSPAAVQQIAAAQVVVVNGLGYEGWINDLIAAAGVAKERLVVASAGVEPMTAGEHREHGAHAHADQDPHAWHDARNGMRYAANLRDAFSKQDPAGAADYAAWTELYQAELRLTDAWIKKQIASLSEQRRVLVTDHDAMSYFARAYGLHVITVAGITTGQEPDPQRFSALIADLRKRQIPAVFIENASNPRLVQRLASESGARLGGELLADSLAVPGQFGDSYIGMFKHNTRVIVSALQDSK